MAVTQFSPKNVQVYLGVSGDTKPAAQTGGVGGPQPGDKFYQTDDFKLFVWTGTAWAQISAAASTAVFGP